MAFVVGPWNQRSMVEPAYLELPGLNRRNSATQNTSLTCAPGRTRPATRCLEGITRRSPGAARNSPDVPLTCYDNRPTSLGAALCLSLLAPRLAPRKRVTDVANPLDRNNNEP